MCGSENEIIHDARQVDLDEVIMKNEEQFVMVRLPLSAAQKAAVHDLTNKGGAADAILAIGTPIPPCADVETVGWGRETSFVDIKAPGCHAVSIHKEWEGGIPLVRRTDMEAQVAKVSAEKDAEIVRLREAIEEIELGIDALSSEEDDGGRMTSSEMKRQALEVVRSEVKSLKGGAA